MVFPGDGENKIQRRKNRIQRELWIDAEKARKTDAESGASAQGAAADAGAAGEGAGVRGEGVVGGEREGLRHWEPVERGGAVKRAGWISLQLTVQAGRLQLPIWFDSRRARSSVG